MSPAPLVRIPTTVQSEVLEHDADASWYWEVSLGILDNWLVQVQELERIPAITSALPDVSDPTAMQLALLAHEIAVKDPSVVREEEMSSELQVTPSVVESSAASESPDASPTATHVVVEAHEMPTSVLTPPGVVLDQLVPPFVVLRITAVFAYDPVPTE